jgi:coenzyme PQQ precursor peptide PqqA
MLERVRDGAQPAADGRIAQCRADLPNASPRRIDKGGYGTYYPQVGKFPIEQRETAMLWRKPKVVEIAIGLEINSYACALVK